MPVAPSVALDSLEQDVGLEDVGLEQDVGRERGLSAMNKGYIEGYFGRLLSWRQRHSVVAAMDADGLDTWVYAPKEELRHRRQWRLPWGQGWLRELTAFRGAASGVGVANLVVALSPGLDMDFDASADLDALCVKYEAALEAGATAVGLFFDDIPLPPGDASAEDARRQAQAAAQVVNRLGIAGEQLWFCPTQYCTSFARGAAGAQSAAGSQSAAGFKVPQALPRRTKRLRPISALCGNVCPPARGCSGLGRR